MAKKFKRNTNRTLNIFAEGGGLALGAAASTVGGIAKSQNTLPNDNIAQQAAYGDSSQDPLKRLAGDLSGSSTKEAISKIQSDQLNTSAKNNTDLLKDWGSMQFYTPMSTEKNLGLKTIGATMAGAPWMDFQGGKAVFSKDNLQASGQGAAAGSSFGPWGALAGGILGGVANLGSRFGRNKRIKDLNAAMERANQAKLNAFDNAAHNINESNYLTSLANYHSKGGYLYGEGGNLYENIPDQNVHGGNFSNGVTLIKSGGTHEENPFTGVPMGIAKDGTPNFVEEGEVKWGDYIFSNRTNPSKKSLQALNLPLNLENKTFAKIAEDFNKESSERPNDPISKNGLKSSLSKLQVIQESLKEMKPNKQKINSFAKGGDLEYQIPVDNYSSNIQLDDSWIQDRSRDLTGGITSKLQSDPSLDYMQSRQRLLPTNNSYNLKTSVNSSPSFWDKFQNKKMNLEASDLRYVPAMAGAIGSFTDLLGITNKPDYTSADIAGKSADRIPDVSPKYIGNYLGYTPLDRDYYLNKLNAQAAGTRNAILNTSGGNRANAQANLLAADYNAQQNVGNLARQAEEYNLNQRQLVENFNRGTNQFNAEQDMKAASINRGNDQLRLKAKLAQAELMDQAKTRSAAARSANLTNLFESLGGIGKEEYARNIITSNPALYYDIDRYGKISYKKEYDNLSPEEKKIVDQSIRESSNKKAYGGYLSKKKSLNINI